MQHPHPDIGPSLNDPLLHNIGGPISRRRSEKIRSSISRDYPSLARQTLTLHVELPPDTHDLEDWLSDMARQRGFKSLDEAEKALAMPEKRMTARILNPTTDGSESQDTLRNALILARTGMGHYHPDGTRLLTHRRLERRIRLTEIDTGAFYDMD